MKSAFHNHRKTQSFTLIELLVSMTILLIVMLMIFQFVVGAQRAWMISESLRRVDEDLLIMSSIIERDLKSMYLSGVLGREAYFYIPDPADSNDNFELAMIVVTDNGQPNNLVELYYRVDDERFQRATISYLDKNNVRDARWDFLGTTDDSWVNRDLTGADYETIIEDGVEDLELFFYQNTIGNAVPLAGGQIRKSRPVKVDLETKITSRTRTKSDAVGVDIWSRNRTFVLDEIIPE